MNRARILAIGVFALAPFVLGACGGGGGSPAGSDPGAKFRMWQEAGHFRGFNINYWNSGTGEKTLADFEALKATGATVAQVQSNEGTRHWASPYGPNPTGIADLQKMVGFCRQVGLDYVIAVRSGPGRQPVDAEAQDTIWRNASEQQRYADMLRDDIVAPYHEDPLFVGINVMVEPNPFNAEIDNGTIGAPGDLATAMAAEGIDVNAMMALFIEEIRSVDATLPIIVQAVGWSDPAYWSLLQKMPDSYVVYDFHTYSPRGYTHPTCAAPNCGGHAYPGMNEGATWNRTYLETVHLAPVIAFQAANDVPILMGEFGMQFEQAGGVTFLSDHVDVALARGWHFCAWNFRSDTEAPGFVEFDYEKWPAAYWTEVLSWFE